MPEFNMNKLVQTLTELKETSGLISEVLKKDKLEPEDIKNISLIYNKRKEKVVYINKWINSNEGKSFIEANKNKWDKLIKPLFEIDKDNLDHIKSKVKGLGADLQDLYKKKSLLIYTKE